jgi:hypothetical protein
MIRINLENLLELNLKTIEIYQSFSFIIRFNFVKYNKLCEIHLIVYVQIIQSIHYMINTAIDVCLYDSIYHNLFNVNSE